jgi:ligand-binding sensor domain-containing protein
MTVSITSGAWRFVLSLALAVLCGCAPAERAAEIRTQAAPGHALDVLPLGSEGAFYAATDSGLLRYASDGSLLRRYTVDDGLGSDRVLELAEGPDGSLWMATAGGVARFDGERFIVYTVEQGLNDDLVHSIAVASDGRIYAGTERGVGVLDGDRFVPFDDTHEFCRRPTYAIHASKDGSLWFAKENALTRRLPDGEWRVFQRDPLLPGPRARIISNSVRALVSDARQQIWIGTHEGLGHFDDHSWRHYRFRERFSGSGGPAHDNVETLAWGGDGALWIGYGDALAFDGGAGATRLRDGEWLHLTVEDGLPDNRVYRIRAGDDGSVWFATANGVARLHEGKLTSYAMPGGLR